MRKRHTPEQVIKKLREAEADLASGLTIGQVCQKLGVSEATYHRWQARFGGMKADEARRLLASPPGGRVQTGGFSRPTP